MLPFYRALDTLATLVDDPTLKFRQKMQPGTMVVFDNRRILHGRSAYSNLKAERHFEGCYVSSDDIKAQYYGAESRSLDLALTWRIKEMEEASEKDSEFESYSTEVELSRGTASARLSLSHSDIFHLIPKEATTSAVGSSESGNNGMDTKKVNIT